MSTQQQIDAWNAAVVQKQQEKTAQETILKVEQEQLVKAEQARINADLAVQRAQSSGASPEQVAALQRQVRLADSAESDARIAAGKTQRNIEALDGSIRFNTSNRDQFQSSLPNQANGASTVGDQAANARANAAEIAPAPQPIQSAAEPGQDFVRDPVTGEQVPSDSVQAEQILAEQNRVQSDAPQPQPQTTVDEFGNIVAVDTPAPVDQPQPQTTVDEFGNIVAVDTPAPVVQPQPQTTVDEFGNIVAVTGPAPVADSTQAEGNAGEAEARAPAAGAPGTLDPQQRAANEQAAAKANAINQATLQSRYKAQGSSDWRVRLQLAPTSNYLYNANPPGILKPLAATNGVVFPYTPTINTSYKAKYADYDLVHSNFRGIFYQNSRVDDISIKGTFTAQDTREADYLLAVIHFFRSVTKMFYGKDTERGTPPPLVFLSGLGPNQFNGHPCVVTNFQYNLPDNVDYIRATSVNNYGTDLLSRRTASRASSISGISPTLTRIANSDQLKSWLKLNTGSPPAPDNVVASVNNTQLANYVPTKMEIDITLIPVQTRSQVSKQFSLKGFANGDLIKGGFW